MWGRRAGAGGTPGWVGRTAEEGEGAECELICEKMKGSSWTWSTGPLDYVGPSAQCLRSSGGVPLRYHRTQILKKGLTYVFEFVLKKEQRSNI